jgi:SAM-dependent methyltransferase
MTTDMQSLKSRLRDTWVAGDFGQIAKSVAPAGEEFIQRLDLKPGTRVLDVACGTGNTAVPAARNGANVTGVDIAANLLEQARSRAEAEGVKARFDVGDAEDLPYADASFDIVISMFGAMFAPRPQVTANELKRVCRSGGLVTMANWTPEGFVGKMFITNAKHVPPPPGMPSPLLWGTEDAVRERFKDGIADIRFNRIRVYMSFPFSPPEVVQHFRTYFGPTVMAFGKLSPEEQKAFSDDLERIWTENNIAPDGTTRVESEYLEVRATKA